MLRWLYNLLFAFAFPAVLPGFLRRMFRRGNYRRQFGQRLGFYSPEVRQRLAQGPPRPWLQAVSVGEMFVALKLIAALREVSPGIRLTLSTTTTTGLQLAREQAGPGVEIVYTPIDSWFAIRRAYDAIRPSQVVIVDGGLWPNLLWEARRRGIPTALVNARLSPRSERRFRRLGGIGRSLFGLLDLVCVPDPGEARRWATLGVNQERIVSVGNVKFDDGGGAAGGTMAPGVGEGPGAVLRALGVTPDRPVVLAASTHAGEEGIVAAAFQAARREFPALFLVIAPRHAERAPEVARELAGLGLRVARRSAGGAGEAGQAIDALLLDTTGELRQWPAACAVVVIGKSFAAIGGQNPAEAVAAGRAVIFGPHMENFQPLASDLVAAGAAVRVEVPSGLAGAMVGLLKDPQEAEAMGGRGRKLLAVHRGAARRTAGELRGRGGFSACQRGAGSA